MNKTTRRAFLATSAMAAGVVHARAQAPIELKLSHYNPTTSIHHKFLAAWADELDTRSAGRLKLRIYPASQLGPPPRQFDLARNGQADIALGLVGATPGRYPMTELAGLPFVSPTGHSESAASSKRLTELAPQYLAPEFAGLRVLWFTVSPPTTPFTSRREVHGPADMRGLKIRFQGEQTAKVLRALGAAALQMPPGDVADGMSKGVIDGAVFNFEGAETFGLGPFTHYVVEPGFSNATLGLVVNSARFDALPADLRQLIEDTTGPAAAARVGADWDAAEQHGRQALLAMKVQVSTMTSDELAKFKALVEPIVAEGVGALVQAGKPAQAFLDAYRA